MSDWFLQQHDHVCSQLPNNFSSEIITGDETWCFQNDPKSKWQKFSMETVDTPTT